ncbi:pyridoxine/pyridoxamine 5'-phosphate oxidase [Pseudoalteromonas byunsanensis]|uniref:Pyridoxamine 5'-phosphate oxidase n=1 Tax=Pseudoalteromonas byunsanensis TaxID=327939 RepID=A0A1S1N1W0_9GAMM|nr:pyridoxal 5'-phosphate synthase [Pseudoalteromonas byunsanensis]OHU95186.1 pyridoxamine 5'-phosphate oxidase [Pseudoalteromonas byunsanensis]
MRDTLRALPVLTNADKVPFNPDDTPDSPFTLFVDWLKTAIDAGEPEPHVMTVSTVAEDMSADCRALILKDVDEKGWYFAVSSKSPKGKHIEKNPNIALTFYWQGFARQVRIKGRAVAMPDKINEIDFLSRTEQARALASLGMQSEPLSNEQELIDKWQSQLESIKQQPDFVSQYWTVYCVRANSVEFWQGQSSRRHTRLRYVLEDGGFKKEKLWP